MNSLFWVVGFALWIGVISLLRRRNLRRTATARYDLDLFAVGILFLVTIGFFWRTLSGDVYQPADGGDLVSFLFPTYRFAAESLASGELPLWNPTLYGGAPFIADIQAGFLYPPNLLLFLLWPDFPYATMQWLYVGHIFWAGFGTYVLLRVLRWPTVAVRRMAAVFGAMAFQFSDPLLIHIGNLNLIAALSWMPWVFAAYAVSLHRRRMVWAGVAGLLFAVSIYAGHAQSSLYIVLALGIYALFRPFLDGSPRSSRSEAVQSWGTMARYYAFRYLAPLLLFVMVAFLLAAPVLLPAIELTSYTERSSFTYQQTVSFSLAPVQLIGLLSPGFFGRGPALHWGLWDRVELPYAGVAALLMALAALFLCDAQVRRQLWPWIGIGVFGLTVAFGIYGIVHGWLTALIPIFDQFRAPARAVVLWTFAVAVVGAVGLDRIVRFGMLAADRTSRPGTYMRLLGVGSLVLLGVVLPLGFVALLLTQDNETVFLRASVAALAMVLAASFWLITWSLVAGRKAGWWSPRVFGLLAVFVLVFDLTATGAYTDVSELDPSLGFNHQEITAYLQSEEDAPFRIDTMTGIDALWQPDTAALAGLEDIGGITNPLSLRHWHDLLEATGGRNSRLYDMLNALYVVVADGTPLPEGKFDLALDAPHGLSLYRNSEAMPRAWIVHEASIAGGFEAAIDAIQSENFSPEREAIILGDWLPELSEDAGTDSAVVEEHRSNSIALEVNSAGNGLLVLSEVWYPGWRARVNGQNTPVLIANGGLRAVAVPTGQSVIEMNFQPTPWRMGLALAAFALLALTVWLFSSIRRRRTG